MNQSLLKAYLKFCLFMLDLNTTHSRRHSCCTTSCCTRGVAVAVRAIRGTVGYLNRQPGLCRVLTRGLHESEAMSAAWKHKQACSSHQKQQADISPCIQKLKLTHHRRDAQNKPVWMGLTCVAHTPEPDMMANHIYYYLMLLLCHLADSMLSVACGWATSAQMLNRLLGFCCAQKKIESLHASLSNKPHYQ